MLARSDKFTRSKFWCCPPAPLPSETPPDDRVTMCGRMRKDKTHISFTARVRRWKDRVHVPFKTVALWVGVLFFAVVGGCFIYATVSAWKIASSAPAGCPYVLNPDATTGSYIQYNIRDQDIEPVFHGVSSSTLAIFRAAQHDWQWSSGGSREVTGIRASRLILAVPSPGRFG